MAGGGLGGGAAGGGGFEAVAPFASGGRDRGGAGGYAGAAGGYGDRASVFALEEQAAAAAAHAREEEAAARYRKNAAQEEARARYRRNRLNNRASASAPGSGHGAAGGGTAVSGANDALIESICMTIDALAAVTAGDPAVARRHFDMIQGHAAAALLNGGREGQPRRR